MGISQTDSRQLRLGRLLLEEFRRGAEGVPVADAMSRLKVTTPKQVESLLRQYFKHPLHIQNKKIVLNDIEEDPLKDLDQLVGILERETKKPRIEGPRDTGERVTHARFAGRERR